MRQVAVTGLGILLPGCDSPALFWEQLSHGRSQLTLQPDPSRPGQQLPMGVISDFREETYLSAIPARVRRAYGREVLLYLASVYEALAHARVDTGVANPERVGLFDGVSRPMFATWLDRMSGAHAWSRRDLMTATPGQAAGIAASLLEVRGSVYTFNGTCSSGAIAIGHAWREIATGELDLALATGHESSLRAPLFAMYREAELVSEEPNPGLAVQPFGGCTGNVFGEGAVTLVLEPVEAALRRGATVYALLAAYQYGNNGFHPTTPDLIGGRPARLIRRALDLGRIPPDEVGFVVGHGNGVQVSDASEENYMLLAFGDRAGEVPLLSNKPIYGHTLGASSAVNAALAVMMLHHQYVVPTVNGPSREASRAVDHMSARGEARTLKAGLALSFGLGGNNAVLAFVRSEGGRG